MRVYVEKVIEHVQIQMRINIQGPHKYIIMINNNIISINK